MKNTYTITVTERHAMLINELLERKRYSSVDDVVCAALMTLEAYENNFELRLSLHARIDAIGEDQ